jgi:peptidoglycan/xylan/chitin deacetylase (PgdA/CDA1 family)
MRTHARYLTHVGVVVATGTLVLGTTSATAAAAPAARRSAGTASITFDDGRTNQYENARPVLDAAGFKGTFYIISDALGWGSKNYMAAPQLRRLAAGGHEIGNHTKTHDDLTTLSSSEVDSQFAASQAKIRKASGVTPTTCAYPYGRSDASVQRIAAKYFSACRGTSGGVNKAASVKRYDLRAFYVTTSTTPAQVRKAAADAKANGTWIVFVFHGVGSVKSSDDVTTSAFANEIKAIKSTGITVRTVGQVSGSGL